MFTVTSRAKTKLKNDLIKELEENIGFARVIYSPSNPARIGFEIDNENEGDLVIPDNEGQKLLLLSPDMNSTLRSFVLDYMEDHDDRRFIINRYPDSILP